VLLIFRAALRSPEDSWHVFCGADAEHEFNSPAVQNKLRVVNLRLHLGLHRRHSTPLHSTLCLCDPERRTPWVYLVATIEQVRSIFPVDSFDDASCCSPNLHPSSRPKFELQANVVFSLLKQKQLFCLIYFIIACSESSLFRLSVGVREWECEFR